MAKQNKKEKKIEPEAKEQLVQPTIPIYPDPVPTIQFAPYPNHIRVDGVLEIYSYEPMNIILSTANFLMKRHKKLLLEKKKIEQANNLLNYYG
jgi:hypothetical protein